jgi:hypothetical protein
VDRALVFLYFLRNALYMLVEVSAARSVCISWFAVSVQVRMSQDDVDLSGAEGMEVLILYRAGIGKDL